MGTYILEIDSVTKAFRAENLLSDIYIICNTGEIVGLFGKNGVGKSTLLKIIFGVVKAENKFIRINKTVLDISYKIENQISYLPQEEFIPNHLSVNKTIKLFLDRDIIDCFFTDKIINSIKNKKIKELSSGELRYLETKLILFSKTKFSLLDEPFTRLSPIWIEKIKKLIISNSKSKGIIICDHSYENVLDITTRLYLINDQKSILLANNNQLIEYGYLPKSYSF